MSEDCYEENKYRGVAIIINNRKFSRASELSKRYGAEKDLRGMKKMFKRLGFDVRPYEDLTAAQMRQKMEKVASDPFHEDAECFACVISTHGEEDVHYEVHGHGNKENMLYGQDGKLVSTRELLRIMASCGSLKGKPKLFFIQACRVPYLRGKYEGYDEGVQVKVQDGNVQNKDTRKHDQTDSKGLEPIQSTDDDKEDMEKDEEEAEEMSDTDVEYLSDDDRGDDKNDDSDEEKEEDEGIHPEERSTGSDDTDAKHRRLTGRRNIPPPKPLPHEITQVPCFNDMLVMFASPQGQFSIRNTEKGSYFLHYLYSVTAGIVDNMEKGHMKKWPGLLTILNMVSKDLALEVETDLKIRNPKTREIEHTIQGKCIPCIVSRLRKDVMLLPKGKTKWYKRLLSGI